VVVVAASGRLLPLPLLLLPLFEAAAMLSAALFVLERQDGGWQVLKCPLLSSAFDAGLPCLLGGNDGWCFRVDCTLCVAVCAQPLSGCCFSAA
jgi:hypothetical protein